MIKTILLNQSGEGVSDFTKEVAAPGGEVTE
jgi:hypothetical protein